MTYLSCFVYTLLFTACILIDGVFVETPNITMACSLIAAILFSYNATVSSASSKSSKGFDGHNNCDAAYILVITIIAISLMLGIPISNTISDSSGVSSREYQWMISIVLVFSASYGILMEFFVEDKSHVTTRAMVLERFITTALSVGYCFYIENQLINNKEVIDASSIVIAIVLIIRIATGMLFRELSVKSGQKYDRKELW